MGGPPRGEGDRRWYEPPRRGGGGEYSLGLQKI